MRLSITLVCDISVQYGALHLVVLLQKLLLKFKKQATESVPSWKSSGTRDP